MLVTACCRLVFIIIKQLGRHQVTVSSLLLKYTTNTPKLVLSNVSFDLTAGIAVYVYIKILMYKNTLIL